MDGTKDEIAYSAFFSGHFSEKDKILLLFISHLFPDFPELMQTN